MIEAILQGGFKSILTALLLIVMSVLSLSSLLAEILRLNREMKNAPREQHNAKGVWAVIYSEYQKAKSAGLKGKLLYKHMDNVARGSIVPGSGHTTILASIGANAPYIGLFGTVVGIYGALHALGLGAAVTADRLAGPVGEALIMTALGLLVAIPAVFGFNYVTSRRNKLHEMAKAYSIWLVTGAEEGPHMRLLHPVKRKRRFL